MHYDRRIKVVRYGSYFDIRPPCSNYGVASVCLYPPRNHYQELGWYCQFEYRNKGFMSKGLALIVNKLRRSRKTICAVIRRDNLASIKVAERVGFIREDFPEEYDEYNRKTLLFFVWRGNNAVKQLQSSKRGFPVPTPAVPLRRVA